MGLYSKANSTERLASSSISQIMTQVTYPLYAEVQDDKARLAGIIRQLTMSLAYITFPLMFIMLLCAKPIFVILYSKRWLDSVPYFQVLCIAGLAYCLQSVNYQSISAIGKSKTLFVWTLVKRTMGIAFVVIGLLVAGMKGLLVGMVINTWFSYAVNIGMVSKYISYKWWAQLKDIMPIMLVSILSTLVSYGACSFFSLSMYVDSIVKIAVYVLVYMGWTYIFKPEASRNIQTTLNTLKKKLNFENSK
jgi:O-antigen/teichoic acid export membrane protein